MAFLNGLLCLTGRHFPRAKHRSCCGRSPFQTALRVKISKMKRALCSVLLVSGCLMPLAYTATPFPLLSTNTAALPAYLAADPQQALSNLSADDPSQGAQRALLLMRAQAQAKDMPKLFAPLQRQADQELPPLITRLSQRFPDNLAVLKARAEWLRHTNQVQPALELFESLMFQAPADAEVYLGLARLAFQGQRLPTAREYALNALELAPENPVVFYLLAQMLRSTGHTNDAIRYAQHAKDLDETVLPERELFLARCYEAVGDFSQAIAHYQRVLTASPDPTTLVRIGELTQLSQSNPESAQKLIAQAVAQDPAILLPRLKAAGDRLRRPNSRDSLPLWRELWAYQPPVTYQEKAMAGIAAHHLLLAHDNTPDMDAIQQDLERLAQLPEAQLTPDLRLSRVKLQLAANRLELSEPLKTELEALAQAADPLVAGEALFFLGDFEKAHAQLDAVDGETAQGYLEITDRLLADRALRYTEVHALRGQQLEALPGFKTQLSAIQRIQQEAKAALGSGDILAKDKRRAEAVTAYLNASRLYPEWDVPYLRLAELYAKNKQWAPAAVAYERAIALTPSLMSSPLFAKQVKKIKKRLPKSQ
jgi:tetratricopeptide (TPR) repeat protein